MKTNRKKMLLSSIAMLLVALVALGSATYAWFSMNRNVTSDNMNIKSAAAKGLQITNDRGATWSNTADFVTYSGVFTPVSVGYTSSDAYTTFGTPYYVSDNTKDGQASQTGGIAGTWASATIPTITATATSTGVASDNAGKASNRNEYFAVYEVGVKSTGDAINTVALAASIQDAGDYARVAIIDNGVQTPSGTAFAAAAPTKVYGVETAPAKAVTSITGTAWTASSTQKLETVTESAGYDNAVASNLTAPADDSTASTKGHYFTIVVWFEGEDAQCTDAAQSKDLELALKFSY